MFPKLALLAYSLLAITSSTVFGQQIGTLQAENHPALTVQQCASGGSCSTLNRNVVLDSNWRYLHLTSSSENCYTGNTWNTAACPDPVTCATNCALDGADYAGTYGITTSGNALTLKFVTHGPFSTNIGSRVYLMDTASTYQTFNLNNQEFSFDVDMSNLPCGLNGALYFVQMDKDGGKAKFSGNKAGAAYGTGYCDTQCPHDLKFINGEANIINWTPDSNDPNSGKGMFGTCCNEMDVWEANNNAAAYTPHVCSGSGAQTRCSGIDCGDGDDRYNGICDKDGCDFNSFRMGDKNFLGPGKTVDTNSKFTVVTQFLSSGTSLREIRRLYVQNGKVIANSHSTFSGLTQFDSVTDQFCNAQKSLFGDTNSFEARGGLNGIGSAFGQGMVLVMSLWDDHEAEMLWLDSDYPVGANAANPGVARGTCATNSGIPTNVESQTPNASVTFSNIKFGPINSTFTQ